MPWKESSVMDERLRFISLLLEGEAMTAACREFGISRKTGYKIYQRYKQGGSEAFNDRSRRPYRYANQLPPQIETQIINLKHDKPHWGARKIRELLLRRLASEVKVPARSTIHAVLDRHGLVRPMGRRRNKAEGTPLSAGAHPNDLWCVDFKGEFKLGNQRYCFPLTVTDHASRYLLLCEALDSVRETTAFEAFEHLLRERGLPAAIRSDNGVPFASPNGLFNLSKLSVWWLRLGIAIERIKPGNPQQNGRHERMHRTLKAETTRPAGQSHRPSYDRCHRLQHATLGYDCNINTTLGLYPNPTKTNKFLNQTTNGKAAERSTTYLSSKIRSLPSFAIGPSEETQVISAQIRPARPFARSA